MPEKPWWRQLNGMPPNPKWWKDNGLTAVGFYGSGICAINALFRVVFADRTGGLAWFWGLLTLPFIVMFVLGLRGGGTDRT